MTVLEMKVDKKPFKVTDRLRLYRKGIMAASLKELLEKGDGNVINAVLGNSVFKPEKSFQLKSGWKCIWCWRRMGQKWMMRNIFKQ